MVVANHKNSNNIGGVMVSVLTWGVVDRGSTQKMIKLVFFCFSGKHAALRRKSKDWLRTRLLCPSEATCLHADSCFSELAL